MSLIHTCELNKANPFDYPRSCRKHSEELKQKPSEWMPWTTARRWRGSPHRQPRNMMNPAWPERIEYSQAELDLAEC